VGLDRQPSREEVAAMAAGALIDGARVVPKEVAVARVPRHGRAGTQYIARVVVSEGKKHEVGGCGWLAGWRPGRAAWAGGPGLGLGLGLRCAVLGLFPGG
jgi:hypothetical protein